MVIPQYYDLFEPVLRVMSDGKTRRRAEIVSDVEACLDLTDEDRAARLESGSRVIKNRIGWALLYLRKAGFLVHPTRGNIKVTKAGEDLSKKMPSPFDVEALQSISPSFDEWITQSRDSARRRRKSKQECDKEVITNQTPEEDLYSTVSALKQSLIGEIHDRLTTCDPKFFEQVVVDVLQAMGYGGGFEGDAEVTPFVKDGGIDGVIQQDRLGLETVYVQAKRVQGTVSRPTIQSFVGAMQGEGVRKGVFVTTSSFTRDAVDYVKTIESRLVLVDGTRLAELMVDHGVGVSPLYEVSVKKVDEDYFEEEP